MKSQLPLKGSCVLSLMHFIFYLCRHLQLSPLNQSASLLDLWEIGGVHVCMLLRAQQKYSLTSGAIIRNNKTILLLRMFWLRCVLLPFFFFFCLCSELLHDVNVFGLSVVCLDFLSSCSSGAYWQFYCETAALRVTLMGE